LRLYVEAAIDFPEEEIDFLSDELLQKRLAECTDAFELLQEQAQQGRVLRDGFQVVIVGKPNAGKSSLLNLLSGQEAAIVTEVAGTTRDILREQIDIDGLAVELVDTAGLREDPDRVEKEGIRRARNALQEADAVLWIKDASEPTSEKIDEPLPEGVPVTVVLNKIDLCDGSSKDVEGAISLSAKTGEGLDSLRQHIRSLAGYVRLSHQALGEITGAVSSDDLLGRIFSEFCIGK